MDQSSLQHARSTFLLRRPPTAFFPTRRCALAGTRLPRPALRGRSAGMATRWKWPEPAVLLLRHDRGGLDLDLGAVLDQCLDLDHGHGRVVAAHERAVGLAELASAGEVI